MTDSPTTGQRFLTTASSIIDPDTGHERVWMVMKGFEKVPVATQGKYDLVCYHSYGDRRHHYPR